MEFDTLTKTATVENLEIVVGFIEGHADHFGLDPKKKFGLLIAIEEAFVNVCHYSYPESEGDIELACGAEDGRFVVEMADRGIPFDSLSRPDPNTTDDIMDREIGGLGVYFIRKMTDEVNYRYEDGRNILRVVMYAGKDTGS